jgi:O-acetylserine/cysteine efflux transporter
LDSSPELLALAGAFFTALGQITAKRSVGLVSPGLFLALRWSVSLLLLSLIVTLVGGWSDFRLSPEIVSLLVGGIIGPVVAWNLYARAMVRLDVAVAYPITQSQALASMLLAAIVLGEVPTPAAVLGAVLIVVGVVLLHGLPRSDGAARLSTIGVLLALGTAACWATSYICWKLGVTYFSVLQSNWIRVAVPALVMTIAFVLGQRAAGALPLTKQLSWPGLLFPSLTGVFADLLAFGFQFAALRIGTVAIITPIVGSSPLFVVLLSSLLLGERLRRSSLVGVLVIVVGVGLVAGLGRA